MLLLEQGITRKKQADKNNVTKLDVGNNSGKYKVKAICNSAIYIKQSAGHL